MKQGARYRRHLPKDEKWETPEIVAAVAFITAIDAGWVPASETLAVLRNAMQRMIEGESPDSVWKRGKGKPADTGLNPHTIVSAYIEIQMRTNPVKEDSLQEAKKQALRAFVDITGDEVNARRQVNRHWKAASAVVSALSTEDLHQIIKPYELRDSDHPI